MSKYYDMILSILESRNETYEKLHPEIKDKFTFSISTLSHRYGITKQLNWKLKGFQRQIYYDSPQGKALFQGRAIHEFIQLRLDGFSNEFRLSYITETYRLTGHIDAINFSDDYIIELKTTKCHVFYPHSKNSEICAKCRLPKIDYVHDTKDAQYRMKEYVIQAGAYAKIMQIQTGRKFNASVFVINSSLTEYELTQEDIDNSWREVLYRAGVTYDRLKKEFEVKK